MVGPPETGVLGVGCGVPAQVQLADAVQDGFRQDPSTHTSPLSQSEFIVQELSHSAGGIGVGVAVGWTYAISSVGSSSDDC